MLFFCSAYGKVFLVRKVRGPDRGNLYAMKVYIYVVYLSTQLLIFYLYRKLHSFCVFIALTFYQSIFYPSIISIYISYLYQYISMRSTYLSIDHYFSNSIQLLQVLKKANIVQKKKTTEHTRTERQVNYTDQRRHLKGTAFLNFYVFKLCKIDKQSL